MKKLTGNSDIEDSLDRLDKLTQEEVRMADSELLKTSVRARGFATVKAYHRHWLRLIIDNCL